MQPDVIVVGAGACGCVMARRLTERSDRTTLLLEAGPDYHGRALPNDLLDAGRNSMTAHDWGYTHKPNARQLRFPYPRGRVVGGSSAVNTCIALRGQPQDYDEWSSVVPAWSWQSCLPAFRRLERDLDFPGAEAHGGDGPLPIRRHPPSEWSAWQAAFVEACTELGYPACPDSNQPGSFGVGPHAMNKVNGLRVSAAEAYLTPEVRARENLQLQAECTIRRVLVKNARVQGVEIERRGRIERVQGARVVLCAGAINTPGILLRSGIGPADEVARLGCELVHALPAVGQRLLDHPGTAIFLVPRIGAPTSRTDPLIQTVLRYPSSREHPSDMLVQPGSRGVLPRANLPLLSVMAAIGKPRGTGRLAFPSADPRAQPQITSQLLDHPHDRELAVDAMLLAYALTQLKSMRKLAVLLWPRPRTMKDRASVREWIPRACDSGYHPCGTAPMGSDPASAATDERGQVFGIRGLYIADASLMPTIPSSNIHLPSLMIAERIAEWLRPELG
jgi:choline dehydrogenase